VSRMAVGTGCRRNRMFFTAGRGGNFLLRLGIDNVLGSGRENARRFGAPTPGRPRRSIESVRLGREGDLAGSIKNSTIVDVNRGRQQSVGFPSLTVSPWRVDWHIRHVLAEIVMLRARGEIGRRARLRALCPKGCAGSNPVEPTRESRAESRETRARRNAGSGLSTLITRLY
jgi:hypothetical protein